MSSGLESTSVAIAILIATTALLPTSIFAVGPEIVNVAVSGVPVTQLVDQPDGYYIHMGPSYSACEYDPNDLDSRGQSIVVLTIRPNDGGYVTFQYRFRTWGHTSFTDLGPAESFAARIHPYKDGWYWLDSERVAEDFNWRPACEREMDTGWVDTTIYTYRAPGPDGEVELRLTLGRHDTGIPTEVEIRRLTVLCAGSATPSSTARTTGTTPLLGFDEFAERNVARRVTYAATATTPPPCTGCCVSPFTALPSGDADSVTMEGGYSAWSWTGKLEADLLTALTCLKDKVTLAPGVFRLVTSYRTVWYQTHLLEVWDKYRDLANNPDPACAALKVEAVREWNKHGLVAEPAGMKDPRHTRGAAIDVSVRQSKTGIPESQFLQYADECNLYRRVPRDKVHFELKP